jgi:hypothetical protein
MENAMNALEVSLREARSILVKTMRQLGYSNDLADSAVWSAFWLEERGQTGVTDLIVYLCLTADLPIDDLKPKRHPDYVISGVCPFQLADRILELQSLWVKKGAISLGAPGAPRLMMPILVEHFAQKQQGLKLHHAGGISLYRTTGIDYLNDQAFLAQWITPKDNGALMLEFSDEPADTRKSITTIKLPARRMRADGVLDLT